MSGREGPSKEEIRRMLESRREEILEVQYRQIALPDPAEHRDLNASEYADYVERRRIQEKAYRDQHPEYFLLRAARRRAQKAHVPCTIGLEHIRIPKLCPILGIPLARGKAKRVHAGSPTVDRIIPRLGYVPGNVAVISWRANVIKNSGTAAEHRAIADWVDAHDMSFLLED